MTRKFSFTITDSEDLHVPFAEPSLPRPFPVFRLVWLVPALWAVIYVWTHY